MNTYIPFFLGLGTNPYANGFEARISIWRGISRVYKRRDKKTQENS
jgi:hypothetical protein